MRCDKCKGQGWVPITYFNSEDLKTVKEWCEECHGSGVLRYKGDRTGIEWERE